MGLENAVIESKEQKGIRWFNIDERNKFISAARARDSKGEPVFAYGHVFILMMYTGLNTSEVLALTWDKVNMINKTLTVGGTKKTRIIELPTEAINTLEALMLYPAYNPRGFVVCTKKGNRVNSIVLQKAFDQVLENADLGHSKLRTLRHTFVAMLYNSGFRDYSVARILGLSIQTVCDTYDQFWEVSETALIEAMKSIENM